MNRLRNLFSEAATLADAVDWLKHTHLRALEGKPGAAALRDGVLQLLGDGLLPDGSTVEKVDSDGLWVTRDGVTLPLEHVSDGYRAVTALVVDLVRRLHDAYGSLSLTKAEDGHYVCEHPGVVLIDEVDAHLHVAWQQRIGFWLTSRFPKLQFIVTTHSPFVCQAAGLILRLPAPGEDRRIEPLAPEIFQAVIHGGVDDAVMSELFGLPHAHSAPAEAFREALAVLESRVLRGKATPEEEAEYQAMKANAGADLASLADQRYRALLKGR